MEKVNVLITGSGSIYGVAVIQSLLKSKLNVKLVAADTRPHALGLHLAHRAYIVPAVKEEQPYLKRLLEIIKKENIHAIFIGSSQELPFFSHYKTRIEDETGTKVFTNTTKVFSICSDKWKTINFLKEHHFPYPNTIRYPEDQEQMDDFLQNVGFPVIVKPRRGKGSEDIHVVRDVSYLGQVLSGKKDMILQQYLPEDQEEFTVGICCGRDGNILSAIALNRHLQDGITIFATSDPHHYKEITEHCKKVASALKPYGPCNFQLRLWKGKAYIFEINPRFSSTTGIRTLLGVNEPEILLRSELLQEKIPALKIQKSSVIRHYMDYLVPTEQLAKLETDLFLNKDEKEE
jgi:carbamoyl-phosphate synthase large subunit